MDEIVRGIAGNGFIKITAINSREMTERARNIHMTLPVVTAALGRTMAAAAMLGNAMKEDGSSLTVRINGGGPIGSIIVVSDEFGNVRGYVTNPNVDLPLNPAGKLDVGGAVGRDGLLTVIRDLGFGEPVRGSTVLKSGEIAEDFAQYFAESEQVPTACALGVLVGRDQSVIAAGGYIAQLMPGAPDELIDRLEDNIRKAGSATEMLMRGTAWEMAEKVLEGLSPEFLERDEVEYRCYCSREKVASAISGIGDDDLEDIEKSGESIEVKCRFCDAVYNFTPEEVKALRDK